MKLKIKLLAGFLLLCNTLMAQERSPTREASSLFSLPPFERAVRCIKFYEGFHQKRHYPYIGYGHRLLPGERLTWRLTEKQADSLLRSDLRKLCALFRSYGKDSLLLSEISDKSSESFPNCWNIAQNFRKSFRRSASACRFVMVRAEYLSPGCNRCPYPTYG